MLLNIALLCLFAASAVVGHKAPNLKVRFDLNIFGNGNSSYIPMPKNINETASKNWVKMDPPVVHKGLEVLELWCSSSDYSFCIYLDDNGRFAGYQIGVAESRVGKFAFEDYTTSGFTLWTTTLNGQTVKFYTISAFFISPELLAIDKEIREKSWNDQLMVQYDKIWLTGFHGKLDEHSILASDMGTERSDFTKQACIIWMGEHYYYKMSKETVCSSETLYPWFLLMDNKQFTGLGFVGLLEHISNSGVTDYFEHPGRIAVQTIVNNGPKCLYELAANPGVLTMHVYFIDSPLGIGCPLWG